MSDADPLRNESTGDDAEHWLRPHMINCPQCHADLFTVLHSPFGDAYMLYCDSCAHRVEVGFYDPTVIAVDNEIIEKLGKMNRASLMNAIEPRLRLCVCGGRFRDRSSRRCHVCQAEVIVDDPSWDLWPGFFGTDNETEELEQRAQQSRSIAAQSWTSRATRMSAPPTVTVSWLVALTLST